MIYDKRTLYETDIRVPLFVRGPDINVGHRVNGIVSHVDLAPTILDMAGVDIPSQMDGRSWMQLASSRKEYGSLEWRRDVLIEYNGPSAMGDEEEEYVSACSANAQDENTIVGKCSCTFGAITGKKRDVSPCDGRNNTYKCIRTLYEHTTDIFNNTIYCEFDDAEKFVEFYNLDNDPYNLHNLALNASRPTLDSLHWRLHALRLCSGSNCSYPTRV